MRAEETPKLTSELDPPMAIHDIGEKPGIGRYCCTNCGWSVYLDNADDRLPPCGNCGKGQNTQYRDC